MIVTQTRTLSLTTLLWLGAMWGALLADRNQVTFDVNPMAPAMAVERPDLMRAMASSRFVEIRLQLSSMIGPELRTEIDEFVFKIESRRQELQVADFYPKTELVSMTEGNIQVQEAYHQDRHANVRGAAGYPGVGWIDGNAAYHDQSDRQRVYTEKPSLQVLTSAGTLARRTGAFFKFKRSPQTALEGIQTITLVFEVPSYWRGDLLNVNMEAYGRTSQHGRSAKSIAQSRFLVAVYQEGDEVAANVARGHVLFEQRLRQSANAHAREIQKRSQPTPFHKIGVALDVVEPEIPSQWMQEVLFGSVHQYPVGANARLPVDVRVAILDYIDQKHAMETLATAGRF